MSTENSALAGTATATLSAAIDKVAFYAMSYGLYLLTASDGTRDNGCIVDATMQSAASPAHITLSCMKQNFTPELIQETGAFNLSILPDDTPLEYFRHFGMQSGRSVDKFASDSASKSNGLFSDMKRSDNGLLYDANSCGFISCKVVAVQDLGSHLQFTALVTQAQALSDKPPITYAGYRARMKQQATASAATQTQATQTSQAKSYNAPSNTGEAIENENQKAEETKGETIMTKWVCKVCGYIYEGEELPADFKCPTCGAGAEMFEKVEGEMKLAAEHKFGIYAETVKDNPNVSDEDKDYILKQLKANFAGECSEVGMYLCMARIAHREGYPEIGLYGEKAAYEEAEHAAKFAELLGSECEANMTDSTKKNLAWRVECEFGATAGKTELATCAKKNGLDAIHDTVHEMARDEARHGKALKGMLERYF